MAGFYFSKILLFKITGAEVRGGKKTLPPQFLVSSTALVPVATVSLDKGKGIAKNAGEKVVPKRIVEDEADAVDSKRVKRGRMTHLPKTRESITSLQGVAWITIPVLYDWTERINIRSCQDELDLAVLEKLPPPSAMVVASVHKDWTSAWAKAADDADLS
ncbi:hypothetical protein Adt_03483 [Abeliophyllum distichum]|uniref:Uncharacterized protein n=1 Tax=Abeliophyllum distichum TaxID=126358 RepID=A0ABD1VYL4_9LAMI